MAISSCITLQFGRFVFKDSAASLSNSIRPNVSNPAFSIPKANPPAPANNSIVVKAFFSICTADSFFNSTTSSISQFNVKHIFSIVSNETGSFFPNRANTLKLIPDASFNSVRFIFLSISNFHNLS